MKILFAKSSFAGPISGADEVVVNYAIELKAAGYQTGVLLVHPPYDSEHLIARLRVANVPVDTLASSTLRNSLAAGRRIVRRAMKTFSPARDLILSKSRQVVFSLFQQYYSSCCEYLKRNRPDVLHVLTPDPGAIMLIRAAHDTGIPVIYQEVGLPFHPPGFEEVYSRFVTVLPLCDEVTALSPALVRELEQAVPNIGPVKVLPLISIDDTHRQVNHSESRAVTFGFSARLEHLKGPVRLLEAFRIAHKNCADIRLTLAGSGSQRSEFIAKSRSAGLEDKIELVGVYKTPQQRAAFMNSFDVFVLPSLTEGTPNVIIEAMAHGKPVIATAVGGVPDLVTDDVGILVDPDDIEAMAQAMIRLANDPALRKKLGSAARKKYERLFTPEVVLPVLIDFYEGVCAKHLNQAGRQELPHVTHEWVSS
ncbi:MAG TPA: glycosyltransferase [Pyrinomonadaceae bacterium]